MTKKSTILSITASPIVPLRMLVGTDLVTISALVLSTVRFNYELTLVVRKFTDLSVFNLWHAHNSDALNFRFKRKLVFDLGLTKVHMSGCFVSKIDLDLVTISVDNVAFVTED